MKAIFYAASETGTSEKDRRPKDREHKIYQSLKKGAARYGDVIDTMPTGDFEAVEKDADMAIVFGCKGSSKPITRAYKRQGKQVMFIDKPHYRHQGLGETKAGNFIRLSVDDFYPHHYFKCGRPDDRFLRWGTQLHPWRDNVKEGKHVLFAGSSQKFHDFHEFGNVTEYARSVVRTLNSGWRGEIRYRPKPSWAVRHKEDLEMIPGATYADPRRPIWKDLENCWALVTWGSNAAIDALISGVPVLVLGDGIAKGMGRCNLREELSWMIANPPHATEEERHQWFCDLAYCQFTMEELKSGAAWNIISEQTPKKLLADHAYRKLSPSDQLLAQYRYLHERGGYFRGLSVTKFGPEIGRFVLEYDAQTLLDYGSGKGQAYEGYKTHYHFLNADGQRIKPDCYDPGVEAFSKKPIGPYDGVICCDVMEHVMPDMVDETIKDIFSLATKFAFFVIHTKPAQKRLPDGRNCHLTLESPKWWRGRIQKLSNGLPYEVYFDQDKSGGVWKRDEVK